MRNVLLALIMVLLPAAAFSGPELKGSPEELRKYLVEERSIMVIAGAAEEHAKADTTVISLAVKTKEDKFQSALDKNIKVRKDVRARLIAGGIAADKVELAKNSNTPAYSWLGDKPSSYEISNEVLVTIDHEGQLLLIADVVDTVKEVFFLRTELKHTKKQELRTRVLEKALEDITAKKQLYERTLGITLVPVRVIDQSVSDGAPVAFMQEPGSYVLAKRAISASEAGSAAGASGFGEIVYRAQAQVEFMVGQKRQ